MLSDVVGLPAFARTSEAAVDGGAASSARLVIERAQAGDRAAFSQLVLWYQRRVVSTAWRLLGSQADAMDAAQEVFLRLHRYLRSYRSDQDFSGWLYRLVVNACHDTRKRRPRHLSLETEGVRGALERLGSGEDIETAVIARQEERLVLAALETLSEKERAALVLRDLEGLPTEKVAEILGSSMTTVRSQISTGRAKLRAFRARLHDAEPQCTT